MTEPSSLQEIRDRIDALDTGLVRLLADRQALVRQAARFKRDEDAVRAPARVDQVIASIRARSTEAGLSPDIAEAIWRTMITSFITMELNEHRTPAPHAP
ncbi:chorismate mutase [Actinocorallia aurea]